MKSNKCFIPTIDILECKVLTSINVIDLGLEGKTVDVQGTNEDDTIIVTNKQIHLNNESFKLTDDVVGIYIDGNAGEDRILNLQHKTPTIIHGGPDDDFIKSVAAEGFIYNIIYGDGGNNRIEADPTLSAVFNESVPYLTFDTFDGVIAFLYDDSNTSSNFEVYTDEQNITHILGENEEFLLSRDYKIGVIDLGPEDDTLINNSEIFDVIFYD